MSPRIDPTWVAWAFETPPPRPVVQAGVERVRAHYSETAEEPLVRSLWAGTHVGMASLRDPTTRCRWPHWVETDELTAAFAYVPLGWRRLVGSLPLDESAAELARLLLRNPGSAAAELDAPLVISIADREGRMVVVNDRFGSGRLYEMRTDEGRVWSNRLGALPLFAGVRPKADRRGWALLAAGGWFMSDSTAIAGAVKVAPGAVIEVSNADVQATDTGAIGSVVARGGELPGLIEAAAEQAVDVAQATAELYAEPPKVDLSGGHDSRVGAAAVIAAGVPGRFWTSDLDPGEADVARDLAAAAPTPLEHRVTRGRDRMRRTGVHILERARNSHLLHDGMLHASTVKRNTVLPAREGGMAQISGHGGEIARGFYYKDREAAERIEAKGEDGPLERLMRSCRSRHAAAQEGAYEEARVVWERLLAAGREHGLDGAGLLDWSYMMDRFAHRSGLASSTQRVSVFSTPAFIRAAFALSPEQRTEAPVHRDLIARLLPEWSDVPFYERQRDPLAPEKRERLWDGEDVDAIEELLRDDGLWGEMFVPERVRELWQESRAGRGHRHYEDVFVRLAYRVGFEDHLALLGERATSAPPARTPAS